MKRIALILPYWGAFPTYFQYFLESLRRNPSIDLLLFTDNIELYDYPVNVHVLRMPFSEFCGIIQSKFDFKLHHLETPYNLCDFKPAYGFVLSEFLRGYDFWGHCDCDLIFGNIRYFFPDELLSKYDRFLTRGHFTLYRNEEKVNLAFKTICEGTKTYDKVFSSSSSIVWSWDEWPGTSYYWKKKRPSRLYDEIIFDDINVDRKHFIASQRLKNDVHDGKTSLCYVYKGGELSRVTVIDGSRLSVEPTLYAHFQKRLLTISRRSQGFDRYIIVPNRIIDFEPLTVDNVRCWGRKKIFYWASIKRRSRNLIRKIDKWLLGPRNP